MVCSVFFAILIGLDIYADLPLVGGLFDLLFGLIIDFADGFIGCSF